ncbi:MAG: exopolyphosphatase [Flavobacteriales bacterium Tduv]
MNISNYAAIDIGSNAIRLLIMNVVEDVDEVMFHKASLVRSPIRLGAEVFTQNKISPENMARVADAMQAYQLLMKIYNVKYQLVYGTSAMREAENRQDLIDLVKQRCGLNIKVISGSEEAQIIFSTELKNYIKSDRAYLSIDAGGGSTEFTLFDNGKVITSQSFPIGTVRLLNHMVDEEYLNTEIKPWIKQHTAFLNEITLIGSGGNINDIFKRSGTKEETPLRVQYLEEQLHILEKLSYEERIRLYHMKPDRADVILPALKIYLHAMQWVQAKEIFVSKIGLADGMIQYLYKQTKKHKMT